MNKKFNQEGFTLVELMIVLSVIAILGIVFVPKVGEMKDKAKESGVTRNVNTVRAFLELKSTSRTSMPSNEKLRLANQQGSGVFQEDFTGSNALVNPFTNGSLIGHTANFTEEEDYVVIFSYLNKDFENDPISNYPIYTDSKFSKRGKVFITVYQDSYVVWGTNSKGEAMEYQLVR